MIFTLMGCSPPNSQSSKDYGGLLKGCTTSDGKLGDVTPSGECKEHRVLQAGPLIPGAK